VQVLRGRLALNGRVLAAGDGVAIADETAPELMAQGAPAEALVFDLP